LKAVYALAYTAGLRSSELFNLTWDDVDLEAGEVRIKNRNGTPKLPPFTAKTRSAIRTIPLSNHTLDILAALKRTVGILRVSFVLLTKGRNDGILAKWERCRDEKKVWNTKDMANNVSREFYRHLRKAGIKADEGKTLTLHTLRKCAGKNWADNIDNPKIVQELMGHANLQTTMHFYNQVSRSDRKKAADVVDGLLRKSDAGLTPRAESA
jgi:integrase